MSELKPFLIATIICLGLFFGFKTYAAPSLTYLGNASSTAFSANVVCLTADTCRTTWPSGGGSSFSYPFLTLGTGEQATSTTMAFLNGFLSTASSTLTNFTFNTATGTEATTTNLYVSNNASTTNLSGTNATGFGLTSCNGQLVALGYSGTRFKCNAMLPFAFPSLSTGENATSTTLSFQNGFLSTASSTFTSTALHLGSTTLQNFTASNSTSTSATTTNLYVSNRAVMAAGLSVTGGDVQVAPARSLFNSNFLFLGGGASFNGAGFVGSGGVMRIGSDIPLLVYNVVAGTQTQLMVVNVNGIVQVGNATLTGATDYDWVFPNNKTFRGTNVANTTAYGIASINTSDQVSFDVNGRGSIFGGKVGIGSSTPNSLLSLQSSTGNVLEVATSSGHTIGGYDSDGHWFTGGPAPIVSSCGTGSPTITGDDQAGNITTGTAASGCTITFSKAYQAMPVCNVSDDSTASVADISSISTTAVSFGLSVSLSGGHLYYQCSYHKN